MTTARVGELTSAQEVFCRAYLLDLNATRAYQAAYPRAAAKSGESGGSRMLRNAKVAARVQELMAERVARFEIRADEVLRALAAIGMSDIDNYEIADDGRVVLRPGISPDARLAVQSVRRRVRRLEGGELEVTTELRLWNKPEALRMLAMHTGVLKEQLDVHHHFVVELPPKAKSVAEWQVTHDPARAGVR